MCRLLGYVASAPLAVADVLGQHDFATFTSLAEVHGDGWGMAWHDAGDQTTKSASSPQSAALDPQYDRYAHQALGAAGLVHLRWATGGLPVTPENSHPFTDEGLAFAHNGHVEPISELEQLLQPAAKSALTGGTDSERYFRFVQQCIRECDDEAEGVTSAMRTLMQRFPNSSLNALLLTPARLFAIHVNSRAHSPFKALRARFESEEAMPARHATEYYAMDYRVTDEAVHIVSSGLDAQGWTPMRPDSAVMIDLDSRELTQLQLL